MEVQKADKTSESEANVGERRQPDQQPETNSQQPTLIHVKDLQKVFVTEEVETHALSGVHLDISKGQYIAIAGPSGCGKSTLL